MLYVYSYSYHARFSLLDTDIGDPSADPALLCWPPDGAGGATVSRRVLVIIRVLVALR